jgi:hypothetical protein
VSGKISLAPVSAGSQVTYKINGQPISGNSIDTTKLPDGLHEIEAITTNPDGTTTTKKQTIKVENGWQYQLMRAAQDHPEWLGAIIGLIGLIAALLFGIFGPRPYVRDLWNHLFDPKAAPISGTSAANAGAPPVAGGPMPSHMVYPTNSPDNDTIK